MTTENIDIKVSEDGSRVVKRNIDDLGNSADKAASSVDKLNAANASSAKVMKVAEAAGRALGLAIRALASATGLLLVTALLQLGKGLYDGWQQSIALRKELIALGGAAGTSASAFEAMAARVGEATGRTVDSRAAVVELAKTGKVAFDQLESLGASTVNLAQLTGDSVQSMADKLAAIGEEPAKTVAALNREYGLFNVTIYEQVRALEEQGKTQEAANVAANALADETHERMLKSREDMGYIEQAVEGLKGAWSSFVALTNSWGRSKTLTDQLADINERLSKQHEWVKNNDDAFGRLTGRYQRGLAIENNLLAQQTKLQKDLFGVNGEVASSKAEAQKVALGKAATSASAAAHDMLASTGRLNVLQEKLNENTARYKAMWDSMKAGNAPSELLKGVQKDDNGQFFGGSFNQSVSAIVEKYGPKNPKGPKAPKDHTLDNQIRDFLALSDAVDRYAGRSSSAARAQQELDDARATFTRGVAAGLLTQDEMNTYLADMTQKLKDQVDPLGAINRHMDENDKLLRMGADERDAYNTQLEITQSLQRKGKTLNDEELAQLHARITAQQELTRIIQIQDGLTRNSSAGRLKDSNRRLDAITGLQQSDSKYTKNDAFTDATSGMNKDLFAGTAEAIEANKAQYADMYAYIDELQKKNLVSVKTASIVKSRIWADESQQQLSQTSSALNGVAQLMNTHSKKAFAIGKAAAIAQAVIQTYLAAQAAAASTATIPFVGWAMWPVEMAAAIAAGLANVSAIRSQQMPAFRTGGEFMVGGGGISDSQMVAFRATPGEHVAITSPEQQRRRLEAENPQTSTRPVFNQNITQVIAGKPDRTTPSQYARAARRETVKELENR